MSKEVGKMVRSRGRGTGRGGREPEGRPEVPADGALAGSGSLAPGQRWSAGRKARRGAAATAWRIAGGAVP